MTVQADLDKLRQDNKKLEDHIKKETIKLTTEQNKQKEQRAQMIALEKLVNRITTSQSALETHLGEAKKACDEADNYLEPMLSDLKRELSQEIQMEIETWIKASDEKIQAAGDQVEDLKKKIAAAEETLVASQDDLKKSQITTDTCLKDLQDLPQAIKDAQARVTKRFSETKSSYTTRQTRKSYYLALTLKKELEQLKGLETTNRKRGSELQNQIEQLQEESKQAQKKVEGATDDLTKLKADLLSQEQNLKQKEQERDGELKKLLTPP